MNYTEYRCAECGEPCELITEEQGGYEEVWGAKVFHSQPSDVTECCNSDDWEEVA
jgi:hypothetical protein